MLQLLPCETLWFTVTRFLLFRDDDAAAAAADGEVATASADMSAADKSGIGRRGWGLSSNGLGWQEEEEACSEKDTAEFCTSNPSMI